MTHAPDIHYRVHVHDDNRLCLIREARMDEGIKEIGLSGLPRVESTHRPLTTLEQLAWVLTRRVPRLRKEA